ncbi:MAG: tetratricopeptide repeat protein [Bryobacter sp.]|nr:tetratricopeptide repeat protein [Bryobacter sp.]
MMLRICLSFAMALALGAQNREATIEQARLQYEKTNYSEALRLLEASPARNAEAWNLIGRAQYMLGKYKQATESFEKATKLDPNGSTHFHWLGRTYGRRAELSSFFSAPGYASKARQNFERAVELNPRNPEAVNDLFEYYLQAPGFLGGGLDKAQSLIAKIESIDPAEKHYALARLAEQKKDLRTAEAQLRRAVEVAPRQMGRIVDLAKFLAKQGRTQESDKVFAQAKSVNPEDPTYLFSRATTLIDQKRNLPEAKQLLERYLAKSLAPEQDNKEEARKLLAKL